MPIGTDNRVFERTAGELAVRYSPQGSNREFCTTTKNLSGGGMRISLLKRLDPGTLLDLEIFKYNTDLKAICRGKIAWIWDEGIGKEKSGLFEAGIQFIDSQFLCMSRLIEHLEKQN
ncbi:MAG: PilZ domain-containing protein [Candidatus Omnitrophica bacterium]|nr:PilZ domain-containing protein [Candidatus Omnitrophota bacterium]